MVNDIQCFIGLGTKFNANLHNTNVQNEVIFQSLQNMLNKNCPKSIITTTNEANKVLNNIRIFTKFYKKKANFKMSILMILIIFILITSFFIFKL